MSDNIAPLLVFFLAFLIAFTVVELLFIYILNRLEKRYWIFVVDVLMRARLHHKRIIGIIAIIGIMVVISLVLFVTPFIEVARASKPILKTFSLVLLVAMVLVYFFTARKMTKLALEKQVHSYLYFVISIILFAFMTIMADQSYSSYQNYINTELVNPATQQIKSEISGMEEESLLVQFKKDYLAGECEYIDYSQIEDPGLIQFVYITTDIELASGMTNPDEEFLLEGQKCTDGENAMLLTEGGRWYWVVTEKL